MSKPRLTGIYAITPDDWALKPLLERVEALCSEGICALQYRRKLTPKTDQLYEALALQTACHRAGVPFIINDSLELALACKADGLHVGASDGNPGEMRAALGSERYLGVSCYNSLAAANAVTDVADYVAFGAIFPSTTKPNAVRASLDLFSQASIKDVCKIAIGGITHSNKKAVIEAGADAVAMIDALFRLPRI